MWPEMGKIINFSDFGDQENPKSAIFKIGSPKSRSLIIQSSKKEMVWKVPMNTGTVWPFQHTV